MDNEDLNHQFMALAKGLGILAAPFVEYLQVHNVTSISLGDFDGVTFEVLALDERHRGEGNADVVTLRLPFWFPDSAAYVPTLGGLPLHRDEAGRLLHQVSAPRLGERQQVAVFDGWLVGFAWVNGDSNNVDLATTTLAIGETLAAQVAGRQFAEDGEPAERGKAGALYGTETWAIPLHHIARGSRRSPNAEVHRLHVKQAFGAETACKVRAIWQPQGRSRRFGRFGSRSWLGGVIGPTTTDPQFGEKFNTAAGPGARWFDRLRFDQLSISLDSIDLTNKTDKAEAEAEFTQAVTALTPHVVSLVRPLSNVPRPS